MTISRRDTIIVAVLMNVAFLAILFMTALHDEENQISSLANTPEFPVQEKLTTEHVIEHYLTPRDEVDQALGIYSSEEVASVAPEPKPKPEPKPESEPEPVIEIPQAPDPDYVEITVKSGDALEKIARHNGTTVSELKKINHLRNDMLRIGQVLKVPVGKSSTETAAAVNEDELWYTVQSGDNPWKIARKFHVRYFDILRLNDLDEEKARNLRPGVRIRVK